MKKSFVLLIVLILLVAFSYLGINIIEVSNINQTLNTQKYLLSQAKLHLKSTQNFISSVDINQTNCINTMQILDNLFDIKIYFSYITKRQDCNKILLNDFNSSYTSGIAIVDIYIQTKKYQKYKIKLHKRVFKKL